MAEDPETVGPDTGAEAEAEDAESLDRKAAYAARRAAMRAKSEARNEAVRRTLVPLAPGERPGPLTASAVVASLSALAFWVSAGIAAFGDVTIAGARQPSPLMLAIVAALLTWMAVGLWRASYGASLSFQGFIVLVLITSSFGLIQTTRWIEALIYLALIAGGGYLFYRLVRIMARMQAPPPGSDPG